MGETAASFVAAQKGITMRGTNPIEGGTHLEPIH
jgi:hypothetical protein